MSDKKQNEPVSKEKKKLNKLNSYTLKMIGVIVMILLFLIPLNMIDSLLSERENRRDQVEQEVLFSWGGKTIVAGPILEIPYIDQIEKQITGDNGERKTLLEEKKGALYIIPSESNIHLNLTGEERTRAIYTIPLYHGDFSMTGSFDLSQVENQKQDNRTILFDQASIIISTNAISGLTGISELRWNEESSFFTPDTRSELLRDQITAMVSLGDQNNPYNYNLDFQLRGGRELHLIPTAQQVTLEMNANWSGLSFIGKFLPTNHQQGENHFDAQWDIHYLSTGIPSTWTREEGLNFKDNAFGIAMVDRVSFYLKNRRAQKYGFLFLLIPFMTFFLFELISRCKIHPLQYLLAGAGNIVFYLLLLSLSEHMDFNIAYTVAAAGVTVLLSLYSSSVLKSIKRTWIMPMVLVISYFFLFFVLQSEDYALLMGSIGLFLMLGTVMFITRRIKWSDSNTNQE